MSLSWRKLAGELLDWDDSDSDNRKKLDAIERQHISDDARLKAVVEAFLLGEGYRPSWRMLIHQLHWAGETHIAEKIKTNAEPQQGEWVYRDQINLIISACMWGTEWRYVCTLVSYTSIDFMSTCVHVCAFQLGNFCVSEYVCVCLHVMSMAQ